MNFLNDLGKQVEKGVQKGLSKDLKQAIASGTSQLEKKVNSINSFTDFKNEVSNVINPNSKNSQNSNQNQNNPAPYPMPGQNQVNNQFYAPNIDLTYHNNQNTNSSTNPAAPTGRNTDQIAGHDPDEFGRSRLIFEKDKVFKLYDPNDPRGIREYQFYEDVKNYLPNAFSIIIPNYFGSKNFQEPTASKPGDYIVMENTNFYLKQFASDNDLCMADIKIGEPVTKFDREKNKLPNKALNNLAKDFYVAAATPQLKDHNFQVLGVKVKEKGKESYEKYGKSFGRQSSILGHDYIFEKFLEGCNGDPYYQQKIISDLLYDLTSIENFLLSQNRYQFKGSSLILSYVAQSSCLLLQRNQPLNYKLAMVRLIDFNNFEGGGPNGGTCRIDQFSLNGVRNIKNELTKQFHK